MEKWIEDILEEDKNNTIMETLIVDVKRLLTVEDELLSKFDYLPVMICMYMSKSYIQYHKLNNTYKDLEDKINQSRRYTAQQILDEFINWINTHREYNYLLNKTEYNKLQKTLKEKEKEYNKI